MNSIHAVLARDAMLGKQEYVQNVEHHRLTLDMPASAIILRAEIR